MAIVAGLERADAGNVRLAGQDIADMNEDELARLRGRSLGIIFQAFHLLPTMTALENVSVPLELAGADDPRGRAAYELEAVGLGHRMTHYPAQLSGGEQQRVAIARATAPRPRAAAGRRANRNLDSKTGSRSSICCSSAPGHAGAGPAGDHPRFRGCRARAGRTVHMSDGRLTA